MTWRLVNRHRRYGPRQAYTSILQLKSIINLPHLVKYHPTTHAGRRRCPRTLLVSLPRVSPQAAVTQPRLLPHNVIQVDSGGGPPLIGPFMMGQEICCPTSGWEPRLISRGCGTVYLGSWQDHQLKSSVCGLRSSRTCHPHGSCWP